MENSGGIQASLAGRYATALFGLARDEKQLEAVGASLNLRALNLSGGPLELVVKIYGEEAVEVGAETWVMAASFAAWIASASAVAIVRYRRLQVTR